MTISRTARALSLDMPGLDDKFHMPSERNDRTLTAIARAFALDAAPLADRFVAHGLPKKFVATLTASVDAFDAASRKRDTGRSAHVAAHAWIERALDAGVAAVQRLDAIVPNYLGDDAVAGTMWARARHVETSSRQKTAETPAAALVPSQAPAVTPPAGA